MKTIPVLFLVALLSCQGTARPPTGATQELRALDGTALSMESLAGKLVLVNFWATWCAPCREEMPALQAVYRRHSENGLVVLGLISSDRASDDDVKRVAHGRGVTYPLARSSPELEKRYGMGTTLPTSVLLDRGGRERARWDGTLTEQELEVKVRDLLAR